MRRERKSKEEGQLRRRVEREIKTRRDEHLSKRAHEGSFLDPLGEECNPEAVDDP